MGCSDCRVVRKVAEDCFVGLWDIGPTESELTLTQWWSLRGQMVLTAMPAVA